MLFTPFSKTWWKSLVKGEGSEGAPDETGVDDAGMDDPEMDDSAMDDVALDDLGPDDDDLPRALKPEPHHHHSRRKPEPAHDSEEEGDHEPFTHEGQQGDLATDDPLAPAFDLERGMPLSQTAAHQLPAAHEPRSNIRSAKEFFNAEILYRYDILEDIDRSELDGRYRIELKGYQGGIWTVIVQGQVEVINRREDADIVITMHQRDFLELVNGQLNPQLAIFAQKMRVQGDLRRCISFDRLLTPYND